MKKALTKKDASEVKDVAEYKWWLDNEELIEFITDVEATTRRRKQ